MSELSEYEVNRDIAYLVIKGNRRIVMADCYRVWETFEGKVLNELDYCNNWNDLMPLVVEHKIQLRTWGDKWFATERSRHIHSAAYENPQRALAECLLLVLEAKANEQS